MVTLGIIN